MSSLMRSPLGGLIARPWFDWFALRFITRRFLPLSRGWAAAVAAEGSLERFLAEAPIASLPPALTDRTVAALDKMVALKRAKDRAAADWDAAAFGASRADGAAFAAAEAGRLAATHKFMLGRSDFRHLQKRKLLRPVRTAIPSIDAVEARFGAVLGDPDSAYAAPSPCPDVETSARFAGAHGPEYWIRFVSPEIGDTVHARVIEPAGVVDPPTLIFNHGLFVESESYRGMPQPLAPLIAAGVRIVEPEGVGHGRRAAIGAYGGECFVDRAPLGSIEQLIGQTRENAVIVDWCRRTSAGPVAVGGISLGALTSQLVGAHASHWPATMRPDALLLVTTCDHLDRIILESSLSRCMGLPLDLAEAGWTDTVFARLRPLTDPVGERAVPPENTVVLLGSVDDVTPYDLGRAMIERWGVPADNLFVRYQGHFSAALGMLHNTDFLDRLLAVLRRV